MPAVRAQLEVAACLLRKGCVADRQPLLQDGPVFRRGKIRQGIDQQLVAQLREDIEMRSSSVHDQMTGTAPGRGGNIEQVFQPQ